MPRRIFSGLLAAGILLLVILWFASGPPPESSASSGTPAASNSPPEAQPTQPQPREPARSSEVEADAPRVATAEPAPESTPILAISQQNPPGTLEVVVMLGGAPLAGVSVRLVRGSVMREDGLPEVEIAAAIPTDARGVAMFEGLAGDHHLIVEARTAADVVATVRTLIHEEEPTWRIVMQLGRGGVEGHVFAIDGAPVAGVGITLESHPNGGHGWARSVRTGDDGSYRIGGVPRGNVSVFAHQAAGAERRVDVVLADGEWKRVDFGSTQRALRWTGRVRLVSGANVEGLESFEVREVAHGEQISVSCAATGEFTAQLPPGEYVASAWTGAGQTHLGRITLVDRDLAQDLVLPGIQLRGRVDYSGTWHDKAQPARAAQVWLERVGGRRALARRNDDRYVIQCLERGDYTLTTWPNPLLGAGEPGIRVQLDGATDDLVVDLTITDP